SINDALNGAEGFAAPFGGVPGNSLVNADEARASGFQAKEGPRTRSRFTHFKQTTGSRQLLGPKRSIEQAHDGRMLWNPICPGPSAGAQRGLRMRRLPQATPKRKDAIQCFSMSQQCHFSGSSGEGHSVAGEAGPSIPTKLSAASQSR